MVLSGHWEQTGILHYTRVNWGLLASRNSANYHIKKTPSVNDFLPTLDFPAYMQSRLKFENNSGW